MSTQTEALIHPPDQDQAIELPGGNTITIKLRGKDTAGEFALAEYVVAPNTDGPPMHIQTREQETFYVIDGTLTIHRSDGSSVQAPAGSSIVIPRNVAHTFSNQEDEPVRFMIVWTPAGLEAYFEELAALLAKMPPGPPDMSRLGPLVAKYGMQVP